MNDSEYKDQSIKMISVPEYYQKLFSLLFSGNQVINVCNHEEVEIHLVLHDSKVDSVVFVVCKDTDVLILMIWVYSELRGSRLEVFCRKGVLRNFAKFTGKHLRQRLFFNKVAGLCEFCKISKNTFFLQNTSGGCFWKLNIANNWYLKYDHEKFADIGKVCSYLSENTRLNRMPLYTLFLQSRENESIQKITWSTRFYTFYSQSYETTFKSPTMLIKIPKNSSEQPFIMKIRKRAIITV